jgi:hypothetical protein
MALLGLSGRPFVDLAPFLDRGPMPALHEEVCLGLSKVPTSRTGGSHRSMGIVPPSHLDDPRADYGEVIARLTDAEFLVFASLGDPERPTEPGERHGLTWGEERDVPLTEVQMRWLELRHGVYFPWKVYLELMPNDRWTTKSSGRGKRFSRLAQLHFPQTVAYVRSLPFVEIGSVKLLGLNAHDDGTVHRDGEPGDQVRPDEFVTFCPAANKRLFLWDEETRTRNYAPSWAYWFNDFDYHGVAADPFFRYSVRVDGVFTDEFREALHP